MYMRLFRDFYGVRPNGMVHVGAHQAEEFQEYEINNMLGNGNCYWIEALPFKCEELRVFFADKPKHRVLHALAWGVSGVSMKFKITNRTASSSVFDLGEHANFYKDIHVMETLEILSKRLDEVISQTENFDFLVLDVQGAELEVIKGMGDLLAKVKWIFLEVSKKELYQGGVLEDEIDFYLRNRGFRRRFVEWDRNAGWGDALYMREEFWQNSLNLTIQRGLRWMYRRFYGRIPQPLFPYLVRWKRVVKTWIYK
jgi:FkbM family methyltransferase